MIPESIQVPLKDYFALLDNLRLAHIYYLMGTENQKLLGEGFKPHKFSGYEVEEAEESSRLYRELIKLGNKQILGKDDNNG